MTQVGDRISQLSSAISVYGTNGVISTAINSATGLPVDGQTSLDNAHAVRVRRDELVALSVAATRNAAGANVGSTTDTFVSLAQNPDTNKISSTYSWNVS